MLVYFLLNLASRNKRFACWRFAGAPEGHMLTVLVVVAIIVEVIELVIVEVNVTVDIDLVFKFAF